MGNDLKQARDHDFEVIDAAISGSSNVEPDDAALTSFAIALKSVRPEMEAGFAVELDERAEAARTRAVNGGERAAKWRRRPQLVAFGCVVALLGASVAVVGQGTDGGDDSGPLNAPQKLSGAPASDAAGSSAQGLAESTTMAAPEVQKNFAPQVDPRQSADALSSERQVVRTASLRIGTGLNDFNDTTDEVIAVTDRAGGFVSESSIADGTAGAPSGNLALLVPSAKFQQTLASLSELGVVLDRQQDTSDVTATVSRTDRNLSRARAARASIVRQLDQATTDAQRADLRAQLRRANQRVARAVAIRRALQRQIRYVPLNVTVEASAARDTSSTIGKAWATAKDALEVIAAVLIVALAIALPIGLIALAMLAVAGLWRRRGRSRAIDSAAAQPNQAP